MFDNHLKQFFNIRFIVAGLLFIFCFLSSRIAFISRLNHQPAYASSNNPNAPFSCHLSADQTKTACGTSMTLTADNGYSNYKWNTGQTTRSITVTSSGTYYWETVNTAYNVVTNGDFESSDHYSGFTSSYVENTNDLYTEGTYAVITDPHNEHTSFSSFGDHTTGHGYMMVINGASVPNVNVWAEDITVQANTTYQFSIWGTSVYPDSPGHLTFSINGNQLGDIQLSSTTGNWQNFTTEWNSGNSTTATISIVNLNTAATGNDFALDDISFEPVCRKTFTVTLNPFPPKPSISSN